MYRSLCFVIETYRFFPRQVEDAKCDGPNSKRPLFKRAKLHSRSPVPRNDRFRRLFHDRRLTNARDLLSVPPAAKIRTRSSLSASPNREKHKSLGFTQPRRNFSVTAMTLKVAMFRDIDTRGASSAALAPQELHTGATRTLWARYTSAIHTSATRKRTHIDSFI